MCKHFTTKVQDNPYDVLQISRTNNIQEIKLAFKTLTKVYHPDLNPNNKSKYKEILAAYNTLTDPQKKLIIDKEIDSLRNVTDRKKDPLTKWLYNSYNVDLTASNDGTQIPPHILKKNTKKATQNSKPKSELDTIKRYDKILVFFLL